MLVRWYGVGIFSPFFRAHAHIDTKRREPYLLDEPYKSILRSFLRLRYSLLPVWYTAFRETSVTGLPVLRPHWVEFPKDEGGFSLDDQYFLGSSGLLVKPVTEKGVTETSVYLPEDQVRVSTLCWALPFTWHIARSTMTTSLTRRTGEHLRARPSLSRLRWTRCLSSFVAGQSSPPVSARVDLQSS